MFRCSTCGDTRGNLGSNFHQRSPSNETAPSPTWKARLLDRLAQRAKPDSEMGADEERVPLSI